MAMASCPIWGGNNWAKVVYIPETLMYRVTNSPRAGGSYEVWGILVEAQAIHMFRCPESAANDLADRSTRAGERNAKGYKRNCCVR